MDEEWVLHLCHQMDEKSTPELISIYQKNDREVWSDDAFNAIERVLMARGISIPSQETSNPEETSPQKDLALEEDSDQDDDFPTPEFEYPETELDYPNSYPDDQFSKPYQSTKGLIDVCDECSESNVRGDIYSIYYGKKIENDIFLERKKMKFSIYGEQEVAVCRKCVVKNLRGWSLGPLIPIIMAVGICSIASFFMNKTGTILSIAGVIAALACIPIIVVPSLKRINRYASSLDQDLLSKNDKEKMKKDFMAQGEKMAKTVLQRRPDMDKYDTFLTSEEYENLNTTHLIVPKENSGL